VKRQESKGMNLTKRFYNSLRNKVISQAESKYFESYKDLNDEQMIEKQREFEEIRKRFVFKPVIY